MLGCFLAVRWLSSRLSLSCGEGSTSVGTCSTPMSSASTSSPAFLDDDGLYPDDAEAEADVGGLSTAIASRRFFLATPGRSNSIVDSVEHPGSRNGRHSVFNARELRRAATSAFPAAATTSSAATKAPFRACDDDDMRPVRKVSVSTDQPRADFLKSMVEMADALGLDPRRDADLARLHDLLLCYIALNERDALRDILGAFSDLMCLLGCNATAAAAADARDQTARG
ncbi:transcription repressor OFP16-like [Phragmites australis]|uniref:transcription repressor OFP16-like n=1 Tax=Phragmites australis TaxID=29695 RepID=UPI002D77AC03|nr:transcription repressor OFP16-like [Phragmites australis]